MIYFTKIVLRSVYSSIFLKIKYYLFFHSECLYEYVSMHLYLCECMTERKRERDREREREREKWKETEIEDKIRIQDKLCREPISAFWDPFKYFSQNMSMCDKMLLKPHSASDCMNLG